MNPQEEMIDGKKYKVYSVAGEQQSDGSMNFGWIANDGTDVRDQNVATEHMYLSFSCEPQEPEPEVVEVKRVNKPVKTFGDYYKDPVFKRRHLHRLKEKIECECGATVSRSNMATHKKSAKHVKKQLDELEAKVKRYTQK